MKRRLYRNTATATTPFTVGSSSCPAPSGAHRSDQFPRPIGQLTESEAPLPADAAGRTSSAGSAMGVAAGTAASALLQGRKSTNINPVREPSGESPLMVPNWGPVVACLLLRTTRLGSYCSRASGTARIPLHQCCERLRDKRAAGWQERAHRHPLRPHCSRDRGRSRLDRGFARHSSHRASNTRLITAIPRWRAEPLRHDAIETAVDCRICNSLGSHIRTVVCEKSYS